MEANKVSDFLGETSNKAHNDLVSVSIVDYRHFVSEDWHYHENVHLSSILVGGNRESRKKEDIIAEPGKILTYREGEIHRNTHTAFPSRNLNVELKEAFFKEGIDFSNFQMGSHAYLSMFRIYYELSINDVYSHHSIRQILEPMFFKEEVLKKPGWLTTLLCLLNDRWQEFVSLEELSRELGLHPVSISKYFTKHVNCTLADYMRKIKVERALHLLFNSQMSMAEIAYLCGFSDQSHMIRLFRRYIGYSPKMARAL